MSEQKCKCCDQFECNCPERCTRPARAKPDADVVADNRMDDYGCECYGCMKYGAESHGLTPMQDADRLLTENGKLREALGELVDVKGSPIKSWAAIGEDFEFWWGKHSDLITALIDDNDA